MASCITAASRSGRGIFSRRVLVAFACLLGLMTWIQLYEPDPPAPIPLVPVLGDKLTGLVVTAGTTRAEYATDKDGFRLAGPKDVLERELKKEEELDKKNQASPGFTGLVGDKVPSVWRKRRISALAVSCLSELRGEPMVTVAAPAPADRAAFGVDDPAITVIVVAGNHQYIVKVGKKSPTSMGFYFFMPETNVYGLLPVNLVNNLRRLAGVEIPEE